MTAATLMLASRRFQQGIAAVRVEVLALGAVVLAVILALAVALIPAQDQARANATLAVAPNRAAALVEATTGPEANQMQAVGDRAKLINAALPFTSSPLGVARPFAIGDNDLDQQRALLCLTQAVYYEAGNEPIEGRRAVAQVVLNRMRHPAFPKSVCGVVYQGAGTRVCQFTFVCDGALYRQPARMPWREAESVARAALAGYVEPSVGESTFYHADYVAPRWAPLLSKVAQIGQHIFYRWPGAWGQPAAFTGHYIGEPRDPLSMRPAPPVIAQADSPAAVDAVVAEEQAGPPVPRAANDVGGLLDTSKGWTLNMPELDDTSGAAAQLIASQQKQPAAAPAAGTAAGSAAQVASR
jgi:hypothetical protein